MVWKAALFGLMIAAPSIANAQTPRTAFQPRPLSEVERASIAEAVKLQLRDPDSAQFRWDTRLLSPGSYCAFVNAKNAFGGYTGFRLFQVNLRRNAEGEHLPTQVRLPSRYTTWTSICGEDGYAVTVDDPRLVSTP